MRISTIAIVAFVLFVVSLPFYAHASNAAEERFENLSTREGVTVHSWVISPRKVRACVVLFSDGGGRLDIDGDNITRSMNVSP
ncbi:hypothetical protein MNBD_GAMMA21-613 [hydrothermal vent metagenome]|uniref:Uncharacterized protein n=1 Tax=hydrothermal vent metagenome TaxID=652676 RepID=A0A3B0ZY68_9ZZZZ